MNLFLEIILTLYKITAAWLTAIYRFFVPPEPKCVSGEVVLVTGGGSGLGRQLALEFGRRKSVVVVWDVNEEGGEETKKMIQEEGGVCHAFVCDVGDREQVANKGALVQQNVGNVTIMVNNAGVITGRPLLDSSDDAIQQTLHVNLLAHFWTTKFFLPSMMENNHGHVVNIASSIGLIGINKVTDYCAAKFGVVGFTDVLNYELVFGGYTGVHTTLVCPAFIKTGMFEGCEIKFPLLVPPLTPEETAARTMQAILTNQQQVCIPRMIYLMAMLKTILPVSAMTEIVRFVGADVFMDSFVGRQGSRDEHVKQN